MSSLMNYLNVKAYTYKETLKKKNPFFLRSFCSACPTARTTAIGEYPYRCTPVSYKRPLFLIENAERRKEN